MGGIAGGRFERKCIFGSLKKDGALGAVVKGMTAGGGGGGGGGGRFKGAFLQTQLWPYTAGRGQENREGGGMGPHENGAENGSGGGGGCGGKGDGVTPFAQRGGPKEKGLTGGKFSTSSRSRRPRRNAKSGAGPRPKGGGGGCGLKSLRCLSLNHTLSSTNPLP